MTSIQEMYWLGYHSPQRAQSPRTSIHCQLPEDQWTTLYKAHSLAKNVSAKIICRHPNYK